MTCQLIDVVIDANDPIRLAHFWAEALRWNIGEATDDEVALVPTDDTGFGILFGFVLWKSGITMLRSMTSMPPAPAPTGELRKVNRRYRCDICGVELRLTMAPDEDPPPPRHCLDDMTEIAPLYE